MRPTTTIATLALAMQTLASPPHLEFKRGDVIGDTPGIPFRNQVPEKGQRKHYEHEDIKMDGWLRGFSEIKKDSEKPKTEVQTFEKRKGGGGGGGGSISGGRIGGGSPFSSGSPGRIAGGSSISPGMHVGVGALTGGTVGYMAGSHRSSGCADHYQCKAETTCTPGCRCVNMNAQRLYFTLPPSLSQQTNATGMILSVSTEWPMGYPSKLRTRLEEEVGLESIPDPQVKCGWRTVKDVRNLGVSRGFVEFNVAAGRNTTDLINGTGTAIPVIVPFPKDLQTHMIAVMMTTYPSAEIGFLIGTAFGFCALVLFCICGGVRVITRSLQRWGWGRKRVTSPPSMQPQNGLHPTPVPLGQYPVYPYPYYSWERSAGS